MSVVLVNGSPLKNGCTFYALSEVAKTLNENGIKKKYFNLNQSRSQDVLDVFNVKKQDFAKNSRMIKLTNSFDL